MSHVGDPLDEFIFVAFNKRVAAVHRGSGEIIWEWKASKGSGYVSLLLDGDRLIASVSGYTYGLDALSGVELWYQPFSGFGTGTTSLVSVRGSSGSSGAAAAIVQQQQQAAAASGGRGWNYVSKLFFLRWCGVGLVWATQTPDEGYDLGVHHPAIGKKTEMV